MPVLSTAPSPHAFASAWTERFARVIREEAGSDGRVSRGTAARISARGDDDATFGDDLLHALETRGQQTISVDKLLREVPVEVEAAAAAIAGPNQRVSLVEAQQLPTHLVRDFLMLRGKLPVAPANQGALTGQALVDAVKHQVTTALDGDFAQKLPAPPAVVRGVRETVDHMPHAPSNTSASIYLAGGRVFVSRSSPVPSPLVGWYDAGPIPVALDVKAQLDAALLAMLGVNADARVRYAFPQTDAAGPTITFDAGPATVRTKLSASGALSELELISSTPLIDPAEKARVQSALRAGAAPLGHANAFVRAIATGSSGDVVAMFRAGNVTKLATVSSSGAVGAWTFDLAQAKALTLQVANTEAMLMASNGVPGAILEAILRTHTRRADELTEIVDPAESPVGLDPARETQLFEARVWGDQGVVVTFDRAAGTARVENV